MEKSKNTNLLAGMLCFSVYSTGLTFNRIYKPILDKLELTYPQYLVLILLMQRSNQTVSELGNQLFLESNTLTPIIKRMEMSGLLNRIRDKKDERLVRLCLTADGKKLGKLATCVPEQILKKTGLTITQLKNINKSLIKLRDYMLQK